jgi:hypothetical protein
LRFRVRVSLVVALLASFGCQPGAGDEAANKKSFARPGEDEMKAAMTKALQKPGAARVKGMPKP